VPTISPSSLALIAMNPTDTSVAGPNFAFNAVVAAANAFGASLLWVTSEPCIAKAERGVRMSATNSA